MTRTRTIPAAMPLIFASIVVLLAPAAFAGATPGSIDPSFGNRGIATADFGRLDLAMVSTLQRDGKILIGGSSFFGSGPSRLTLARFTSAGRLDASFGKVGKAVLNIGDWPTGIAVQPSGRIIVEVWDTRSRMTIVGLTPRGSLDKHFGHGGIVVAATVPANYHGPGPMTIAADGSIVLGEWSGTYANDGASYYILQTGASLVRYTVDGALDRSFGVDGRELMPFPAFDPTALLPESGGKLVVAGGPVAGGAGVIRLLSNGALDPTFGRAGVALVEAGSTGSGIESLTASRNGMIVGGGWSCSSGCSWKNTSSLFFRMTSKGRLDPSFGSHGVEMLTTHSQGNETRMIAVLPRGGIVALTRLWSTADNDHDTVLRLRSDGALDPSFGSHGMARVTGSAGSLSDALALFLQGMKPIVTGTVERPIAGSCTPCPWEQNWDYAAVRLR